MHDALSKVKKKYKLKCRNTVGCSTAVGYVTYFCQVS